LKHIIFYLDFISPYSYLAFEKLPQTLMGLSYSATYRPVLLGALLRHHGLMGPAEVPAKREWTYRHVQWLGHQQGVPLEMPKAHPLQSLAAAASGHRQRRWGRSQPLCLRDLAAACLA
jgi:2-hydroxychromene-2-carboxylate isomerase